ncbi:hypothetical protein AgCh_009330 [Apium graveolens]
MLVIGPTRPIERRSNVQLSYWAEGPSGPQDEGPRKSQTKAHSSSRPLERARDITPHFHSLLNDEKRMSIHGRIEYKNLCEASFEKIYANLIAEDEEDEGIVIKHLEDIEVKQSYVMVGRFLIEKSINFNAMRNVIASLWRSQENMEIHDLGAFSPLSQPFVILPNLVLELSKESSFISIIEIQYLLHFFECIIA